MKWMNQNVCNNYILFWEKHRNKNHLQKKMSETKKLKKPVNCFNFVMLNIPTSQCIIHINYSFFFIRFGESRTDKRNSTRQLIKGRKWWSKTWWNEVWIGIPGIAKYIHTHTYIYYLYLFLFIYIQIYIIYIYTHVYKYKNSHNGS